MIYLRAAEDEGGGGGRRKDVEVSKKKDEQYMTRIHNCACVATQRTTQRATQQVNERELSS